ncbi:MAG: hypothetical protein R2769_10855 [Saprospiraceae bacterium]
MKKFKIKGKVTFKDMGPGAWGIVTREGQEYRPVNFPEQLKKEGAEVEVTAVKSEEEFSVHMWGEAVEIVGFGTLLP